MDKYTLELTKALEKTPETNRLLFAFWVSKRLFHNYVYFNSVTSFGNVDSILDAFNLIEKYLIHNTKNEKDIINAINDLDQNTPDTNDFDTILASFALDSCNALSECLRYILDNNISHIIDVGIFARDTVDMFIQEIEDMDYNDPNFENNIENNEFMKNEMNAQKDFLSKLKNAQKDFLDEIVFNKIINPDLINDIPSKN